MSPGPREAAIAMPQSKSPKDNGLGPLRACEAGIQFSHQQTVTGELQALCSQGGTVNSDIHRPEPPEDTARREQQRVELKTSVLNPARRDAFQSEGTSVADGEGERGPGRTVSDRRLYDSRIRVEVVQFSTRAEI